MIIQLLLAALLPFSVRAAAPAGVTLTTAAVTAANERVSARCAKAPFDVDGFLAVPAQRADLAPSTVEEQRDLMEYSVCRALQGAAACAALEGTKASPAHCSTLAAEARFAREALKGGDALGACRAVMALDNQRGPAVERACGALVQAVRGGGVAGACPALEREGVINAGNTCQDITAMWSGAAKDCDRYKDGSTRRECVSRAALIAGLREPGRCSSSPSCQALSGQAAACEPLKAQFTRSLCARAAKDAAAAAALAAPQKAQIEAAAKEKAARTTAAAVAAANARLAAEKAKVEAAAAKAKAEALAEQQKVAKRAAEESAKARAALAAVQTKAEAEAQKEAKAKAEIAKKAKPQFRKGAPMQDTPIEAKEIMKALEEGRPMPKPKAPVKKAAEDAPAPDQ